MTRSFSLAAAAALSLCVLGATTARADSHAEPPLDDLVAQAKQQGKPLVIDFYAVWCKPCKEFAKNVLPKPEVQKALGSVVFAKYDAERGNGQVAAKRYGVTGYPTFVVVDGAGTAHVTKLGSMTAPQFVDFVHSATMAVLDEAGVERLVSSKATDAQTLLAAARWYRARGQWKKADRVYVQTVAADKDNAQGLAAKAAWECMQLQRYHAARTKVVRQAAFFVTKYPGSDHADTEFLNAAHGGSLPKARLEALGRSIVRANWDSAGALNGLTYSLLSAGAVDAALSAATRQVALLPKEANPLDTLAEVHHYRRDRDKAIAASQQGAAMLAKDPRMQAVFAENLKRFSAPTFAPSDDVERATRSAKTRLARLPGVDPHAQKLPAVKRATRAPSALATAMKNFRTAYSAAAKACATSAGKLTEAYVRVEFGATKADATASARKIKPKRVVVLEPAASWRLKRCISKNLRGAEFDELPDMFKERYTSRLSWPNEVKPKVKPWAPHKLPKVKPWRPNKKKPARQK